MSQIKLTASVTFNITKCDECPHKRHDDDKEEEEYLCSLVSGKPWGKRTYEGNCIALTFTCPLVNNNHN